MSNLTPNSIAHMVAHGTDSAQQSTFNPILQVIEIRTVKNGEPGKDIRRKVSLSDGTHFLTGFLSQDCAGLLDHLAINTVIQVTKWMVQAVHSSKAGGKSLLCVVMGLAIIENPGHLIGQPKKFSEATPSGENAPPSHGPNGGFGQPQAGMYGHPGGSAPAAVPARAYGQPQPALGQQPGPGGHGQLHQQAGAVGTFAQPMPVFRGGTHNPALQVQPSHGHPSPGGTAASSNVDPTNFRQPSGTSAMNPAQNAGPYAPVPQYNHHRGPTTLNSASTSILPIANITPYQNRWTIRGRCTTKSEMRRYNKNGRAGCVFNFDLMDASGEVRCVCFGDVAERIEPTLRQGCFYQVSSATAKTMDSGKRKWNQTGHDCEITIEKNSKVEEIQADNTMQAVPAIHMNTVKVGDIENMPTGNFVDVIAVVDSCNDVGSINRRDGTETKKRSMQIRDDSGKAIELTLWGEKAVGVGAQIYEQFRAGVHSVLAVKGAKIGEFNGKNISTTGSSQVLMDAAEVPGVPELQHWFQAGGSAMKAENLTKGGGRADRRVTTGVLTDELVGSGQAAWVKISGYVTTVRDSPLTYPACSLERNGRTCNKKLTPSHDGSDEFYCETCGQHCAPTYRYLLQFDFQDFDGCREQIAAFGDSGDSLMTINADLAHMTLEQVDEQGSTSTPFQRHILQKVLWKPKVIKLKCQEDTYQEETRIKYTLQNCEDCSFKQENQVLIEMINDMSSGQPIKMMQPRAPKPMGQFPGQPFNGMAQSGMPGVPGPFGGGSMGHGGMFGATQGSMQQPAMYQQQQAFGGTQFAMQPPAAMYQQQGGGMQGYPQGFPQHQQQAMQGQQPGQQGLAFLNM